MLTNDAQRRRGAWLALFALWLQLALTFGHHHAEDFAGLVSLPWAAPHISLDRGAAPAAPATDGCDHDDCALCASIALAANVVLPDPPPVVLLRLLGREGPAMPDAFVVVAATYRLFESRAPPVL
jgi:hypothetical protein